MGKVAIAFDLADDQAAKILILRQREKTTMTSPQSQDNPSIKQTALKNVTAGGDINGAIHQNITIRQVVSPQSTNRDRQEAIAATLAQSGDCVRILVVAANPLGSSPLKLDHEVKTIQEALRRSRKRDNFMVEYRLAATPSELRRALLDLEPHVLHFSGHGSGEEGLLFVSDESAGAIYRSDSGEVRSRSTNTNEIKFVPAQPLANLLQLCEEHLECVVLNACYSDVQGNAISANIPFTIGMRDLVADNVAIKFSQGFYDAIGAGKGYEMAFKWGKIAIEFDLADDEAAKIFVLRKNEKTSSADLYLSRSRLY